MPFTPWLRPFRGPGRSGAASSSPTRRPRVEPLEDRNLLSTFGPSGGAILYPSGGTSPVAVAVGDFNGDSFPDLAVVNRAAVNGGDGTVGVLLGDGDGAFAKAATFGTGGVNPDAVAVGDFNRDGKQDLAVANAGDGTVGVLLGDGAGTFANPVAYGSGGANPVSLAVGDFNGDGVPDLAAANAGAGLGQAPQGTVGVLLGTGTGAFQSPVSYSSDDLNLRSVAVGDFNGDGFQDLAVANAGDGTLRSDIPPHGTVGVLLGDGSGTFTNRVTLGLAGEPNAVAAGDFNGDGHPDLAAAIWFPGSASSAGSTRLAVLAVDGNGAFRVLGDYSSAREYPYAVAAGDFNGDGQADLAAANGDGNAEVRQGDGTGALALPV